MSAVDLIWRLAGEPAPVESAAALLVERPAVCAVAGQAVERSADLARALGSNFTDQSLFRAHSQRVGPAALWACSGKPPATLRMWSVVAIPGVGLPASHEKAWIQNTPGLCLTNRAATGVIIDTLACPPDGEWVVTVATSGQKHVVPYAEVNRGRGRWTVRMETANVTGTPAEWAALVVRVARLRAAGHRAEDIRMGQPSMAAVKTGEDLATWRRLSVDVAPYTRSPLLDLALWCLTKEQINARA